MQSEKLILADVIAVTATATIQKQSCYRNFDWVNQLRIN